MAVAALPAMASQPEEMCFQPDRTPSRPDVMFIFVDDMTFDGLHTLGDPDVITPHLDSLVESGVRFTNCYNMGGWSGAVSTASRSQLVTGQYLWNTFAAKNNDRYGDLYESRSFWPQVMHDAGYRTYQNGKWHVSHISPEQVFDFSELERPGMPKTVEKAYNRPLSRDDNDWLPWDQSNGGYWENGRHWSEILADHAIAWLEENRSSEQPLFMYCAFNAPHDPRQSPKEFVDMYDVDKIHVPESFLPEHPYKEEMGCGKTKRDERLAPFPRTEYAVQKHRQEYYALITHLDVQVGRMMQALRESGRAENTVVVFAADNGLALGKHGLMGKQNMYEHSVKIPLAFSGAGIPAGETRDQMVYLQDLVPTLYDMLDIEAPASMQFHSQKGALLKDRKGREAIYCAFQKEQRMIREGDWKLFFILEAHKAYLFNVAEDPQETHNYLEDGDRYLKIARNLARKYVPLAEEAGDEIDLTGYFPELFK